MIWKQSSNDIILKTEKGTGVWDGYVCVCVRERRHADKCNRTPAGEEVWVTSLIWKKATQITSE